MKDGKYRLYVLEHGDIPSDTEFYFLLPDIDLVYTQEKPARAAVVENPEQIPAEARQWLAECIASITERWLKENAGIDLTDSRSFMDRLRDELEAERAKGEAAEHERDDKHEAH